MLLIVLISDISVSHQTALFGPETYEILTKGGQKLIKKNLIPIPFPSEPIFFLYKTLTNNHRHSSLLPLAQCIVLTSILTSTCYLDSQIFI